MEARDLTGPVVVHSGDAIRYANEEFCALLGLDDAAAVVGESLAEFVTEQYREQLAAQFETVTRDDAPLRGLTLELARPDGATHDAIAVSSPVEWEGATRIHTTFIDIVESKDHGTTPLRESATHQSPIGVTIADATREDEPLIYVNDTFVDLTGYPREEALGQNCRFLQGEATREEPVAEMRAAVEAERPVTVELRNYRKDGSMFWNRVTISPVEDADGDVTHFLGFQQDVTDEKVYEREKALFETHAEMSEHVMFVTDAEGTIEYVNPAFERVTGYTAAEAVGETPRILNSGQQDDQFYEELWETITSGEIWEADLTNQTKSGRLYQAHQKIVPITDDRGKVTHFAAIEPDVTDEHLTEQVLDVLNRILRHNVRTSINVIEGYTDLLETDLEESEREAAIAAIRERTTELKELGEGTTTIRNLLEGREDPTPLSVADLLDLLDHYRETHDGVRIDVTATIAEEAAIRHGSVFQIAFEEVIDNAIVHTDRETSHIEVTVSASTDGDHAVVEVADDGTGVPESEWEIIKTGTETPLKHTSSIGLWLVYWSITALGGTVDLSPNDPRGSVVTLRVPLDADTTA